MAMQYMDNDDIDNPEAAEANKYFYVKKIKDFPEPQPEGEQYQSSLQLVHEVYILNCPSMSDLEWGLDMDVHQQEYFQLDGTKSLVRNSNIDNNVRRLIQLFETQPSEIQEAEIVHTCKTPQFDLQFQYQISSVVTYPKKDQEDQDNIGNDSDRSHHEPFMTIDLFVETNLTQYIHWDHKGRVSPQIQVPGLAVEKLKNMVSPVLVTMSHNSYMARTCTTPSSRLVPKRPFYLFKNTSS
ncbi:hypothetical protein M231_08016 [Tremella mesenterica]|uniref:Uncharacterized protein n=1 Tax=Tremella mesenterica TaxID=5217 RepID=A0A4Q1B7S5_TREME|nr:hypothetical protein M231_08016 [Tremella mesenterica]